MAGRDTASQASAIGVVSKIKHGSRSNQIPLGVLPDAENNDHQKSNRMTQLFSLSRALGSGKSTIEIGHRDEFDRLIAKNHHRYRLPLLLQIFDGHEYACSCVRSEH
jgi:hypothetical protein